MLLISLIFFLCTAIFIGLCIFAAANDVQHFKLPNKIILYIILLFMPLAFFSYDFDTILSHLSIAGIVLLVSFTFYAFKLFGAGDAKFITAVALWAGPDHIMMLMIIMGLVGGMLAAVQSIRMRHTLSFSFNFLNSKKIEQAIEKVEIPYGVAIASGAVVVAVIQVFSHVKTFTLDMGV